MADQYARIAGRAVVVSEGFVEQSHRAAEQGVSDELDLLRDRTQLTHNRVLLEQAAENKAGASAQLAALLNVDQPITLSPLDSSLPTIDLIDTAQTLTSWLARVEGSHPGIITRESELAGGSWESRRVVWGPLLPDIEAGALITGFGPDSNDLRRSRDYSVAIRWTVGPGGLLDFGRIRSKAAKVDIAKSQLATTRADLQAKTAMWYELLQIRKRSIAVAAGGLIDARRALQVATVRRETGVGMALEVIDSAEALARAEREYAQAIVNYNIAQMEVLALFGDFGRVIADK